MNYRHIYHAGNFADVFKHIILTLILTYMQRKPAAFRVIDTHAGTGLYDLASEAAQKTAEGESGLFRFLNSLTPEVIKGESADYPKILRYIAERYPLISSYMQALASANKFGAAADGKAQAPLRYYPGSPLITRSILRKQDRLTAIEFHPKEYDKLKAHFAGDYQSRILHLDGYLALKAQLPPKEKRGLILVDPPFEEQDEFSVLTEGISQALRRFPQGGYMIWYPVKNYRAIQNFTKEIIQSAEPHNECSVLQAELRIRRPSPASAPQLDGSGLMLINPPYILSEQMKQLEPLFLAAFAEDSHAALRQIWLKKG